MLLTNAKRAETRLTSWTVSELCQPSRKKERTF